MLIIPVGWQCVEMRHIGTPKWHRRLSAAPLAALVLTAAWPAMAQKVRFQYLLPPSEFDVPYTGKLTIWRVRRKRNAHNIRRASRARTKLSTNCEGCRH